MSAANLDELIAILDGMRKAYGNVPVGQFFEGCLGEGIGIHYEPEVAAKTRGTYVLEPARPATVYLGESWYN